MDLYQLRFFLLFSAIVWGAAILGVVVPWPTAESMLQEFGAGVVEYDPMLDYWLRMAAGAFTLIGGLFVILAWNPRKYMVVIPWFGWLMVFEGSILLIHGLRLGLPLLPYCADASACMIGGFGILRFSGVFDKFEQENIGYNSLK